MRESRSWPRSSVPNGWSQDGALRRAVKSISLIGTRQSRGPIKIASASSVSTITLTAARRCRRKRRRASRPGEKRRSLRTGARATSTVGDAWVKPAIDDIGQEVEENDETGEHEGHRHDNRRVVGKDRTDQQRADTGNAENLLGDDGPAEHRWHLQRHQRHDGNERVAHDMLDDDLALADPLGARGRDVIQPDYVEHGGAHITCVKCGLE